MTSRDDVLRSLGFPADLAGDALEVMNGPDDGKRFPLEGEEWVLGRDEAADIVLPCDPLVSRRHARLAREKGEFYVVDLDSTHGTVANGERLVGRRLLRRGDLLVIGATVLELRRGSSGLGADGD